MSKKYRLPKNQQPNNEKKSVMKNTFEWIKNISSLNNVFSMIKTFFPNGNDYLGQIKDFIDIIKDL